MSYRKPLILMHVEDRRRDALVCVVLAKLLRFLGNRVILCNRATNRLYWSQLRPDVMVIPYVWTGVRDHDEFARRAKRTRMIVFPTEGMVVTGEEWVRDYARAQDPNIQLDDDMRRRYSKHLTKALLWGPAAVTALVDGGVLEESQVATIGCPRLDFFQPGVSWNGLNAGSGPLGVGFAGGFPNINEFDQRSVFATIDGLREAQARGTAYDEDGNLEDLIWWYYAGARLFLDLLDEWIFQRGGVAYYRPHPFEHFGSYNYLQKKYGEAFVLDEPLNPFPLWLASVSALVINRSTSTVLPAFFTGKPVITVQQMINAPFAKFTEHDRYNTGFVEPCYKPRTIAEAADLLQAATRGELPGASLSSPDLAELLLHQVDWPRSEFSMTTAAREIDLVAKEAADVNPSPPVALNLIKSKALPYALKAALKLHEWRHHYSEGRRQVNELSRFWPWHRYEWRIGDQFFRAMLPKMMEDLNVAESRQDSLV